MYFQRMKTIFHHLKLNDIFTLYLGIKVEPFQCVDCMRVFCYIVSHETSNSTEKTWSLYHSFEIGIVKTLKKVKIWKSIRPNLVKDENGLFRFRCKPFVLTISVRKPISLSSVERWEKCLSFSKRLDTWCLWIKPTAKARIKNV